jgi:UDP:flavonoid glycosyltransferase YjiC (YdhE family)
VLFTHCIYEQAVRQYGLDFVALDTPEQCAHDLNDESLWTGSNMQQFVTAIQNMLRTVPNDFRLVQERCMPENALLIVHRNLQLVAQSIAEKLHIPLIMVFPAPTYLLNLSFLESLCNISAASINQVRVQLGLPPVVNWGAWLRQPGARIGLWPAWYAAPDASWPLPVVPIGFVLNSKIEIDALPDEVLQMIGDGARPVLLTHGTSRPIQSHFFTCGVEACRMLKQSGLLVSRYEHVVPAPLPATVKWFKQLPFGKLLPSMGVIVHHGGIGTIAQALASGVPQLVLAQGFDRPDNGMRLQRLGVAEMLNPTQWRPEIVGSSLRRLLTAPAVKQRCRELSLRLSKDEPMVAVSRIVENVCAQHMRGEAVLRSV